MASKTTYELEVKIGAGTSPSWKSVLGKVETGLQGVNSLSNKIMAGVAAGVTAAAATATYALSEAVDTYVSFEQEMATVQSISGATPTQFLAMKEAALDAGASTVFTATEAASALEYMSLAGWDTSTAIEGLTPILSLAAATGKELQTTSDLVTDSMSALGIGVGDLGMYLDKLVMTNNKANTTAEQLMEALVKTGGSARVLNVNLDDTVTALGVLANNGLKGAEAGTALNAIFVRLAGNTTAMKELSRLKVDIWDDKGQFVGFEEALGRIRTAMEGLTPEQQAQSLKNVAGVHYYSQMQYLLDAVAQTEDGDASAWDILEENVAGSTGALSRMYDTTTDTLENAHKRLESAKEDMQIRLVDVFSDDAKDFVSWLAESLPNVTESIVDFAEAHQGEFAEALESVGEGIENLWEFGISAGEWIIRHKGAITGALSAMTGGMLLLKGALAGINVVKFFTNPWSAAITVAGAAIAAIGGVKGAIQDAEDAAVSANLAEHFGDLALSMEDVERVASHIVGSESLTGVLTALDEYGELDSISGKFEEAARELEKTQWKVSVGVELDADEQEGYRQAIDDYISSAQKYAQQTRYAVSLSMDFAFDDSYANADTIEMKVQKFYRDKETILSGLGKQLNRAVNDALNDGIFDIHELPNIVEIQKQIAEVEKALAVGEMDAQWALLGQDYAGMELTPESFQKMLEEIDRQTEESMTVYKEAYTKNYSALSSAHEGGGLSDAEYEEAVGELNKEYAGERASVSMRGLDFVLNTIYGSYGDEIGQYEDVLAGVVAEYSGEAYNGNWSDASGYSTLNALMQDISSEGPDKASRHAVGELVGQMDISIGQLYTLMDDWDSLTPELQAQVQSMAGRVETLQGMSVDVSDFRKGNFSEGFYRDIVNEVSSSGEETAIRKFVDQYYEELTGYTKTSALEIESSLEESKSKTIRPAIDSVYSFSQEHLDEVFSQGLSTSTDVNLDINPKFNVTGFVSGGGERTALKKYGSATAIMSNAKGGIYTSPILTTFAEEGPEAAVPLDGSDRAKQLWIQAGQILGTLPEGTRDQELLNGVSSVRSAENTGKDMQIVFSPTITIQGSASRDEVHSALSMTLDDLKEMLDELDRQKARTAFG